MARQITMEVTIGTDGNPTIEVKGCPDNTCFKETQDLEAALGKVKERSKKAEASIQPPKEKLKIGSK